MLRVTALSEVAAERAEAGTSSGPWSYDSQVEDFELTYRLRRLGWATKVSYEVRAYTDAMVDLRSLWAQRMKWQGGTVEDLLEIGVDRLTLRDWGQQAAGLLVASVRVGWVGTMALHAALGDLHVAACWLVFPLLFVANDVKQSLRVPHRDWKDIVLAAALLPQEMFAWLRAGWFLQGWAEALSSRINGRRTGPLGRAVRRRGVVTEQATS